MMAKRPMVLFLLSGLWTAVGCSPQIYSFKGVPRRICPQTKTVTLTWSVDGSASLSADPELTGLGRVPECGQRMVEARPAKITLTASKLFARSVNNEWIVTNIEPDKVESIGPNTEDVTCDEAEKELIASLEFEREEYDPAVIVKRLSNPGSREVSVAHRGRTWTVPPGKSVDLVTPQSEPAPWSSTAGTWILRVPLHPQEQCGTRSLLPALHDLLLNAALACREGSP
jgi:hypothetical protein